MQKLMATYFSSAHSGIQSYKCRDITPKYICHLCTYLHNLHETVISQINLKICMLNRRGIKNAVCGGLIFTIYQADKVVVPKKCFVVTENL